MTFLKIFSISFVVFFIIDIVWLGFIAKDLYRDQLGFLMAKQVMWLPAILFYILFIAGLTFFVIYPQFLTGKSIYALLYGGFFGLVCYSTYDLSNLATIEGWPVKIVMIDLIWGTFISGITSYLACLISCYFKHYFN